MIPTIIDTKSAEETIAVGERLGAAARSGLVLALVGDLGAGKTTFTRGLVRGAGAPDAPVVSPTFVLGRLYEGRVPVRHYDLYRLPEPADLEALGYFDFVDAGVSVVEWADRTRPDAFPDVLRVVFINRGPTARRLKLLAHGPGAEAALEIFKKK